MNLSTAPIPPVSDSNWDERVNDIVMTMVRPLIKDGGKYSVLSTDAVSKQVIVSADTGDCEDCLMSDAALAGLLQEGIRRSVDPVVFVTVISADSPNGARSEG